MGGHKVWVASSDPKALSSTGKSRLFTEKSSKELEMPKIFGGMGEEREAKKAAWRRWHMHKP